jgi:S-formylglutathione hydrolase FrmB
MASIQATFFAKSMKRQVTFNAFIPKEKMDIPGFPAPPEPMKTIILLHGFSGIGTDWAYGTRVQELSMRHNIAVLLPSGENSFYLDDVEKGEFFGEYVGRELIEFARSLFGLSSRREDTYIGGFSMGGYGAIRNGLKYHENFGGIVALSSALIVKDISKIQPGYSNSIADYAYYRRVFGEPGLLIGSDKDPETLVESLRESGGTPPGIFMACGTDDFLIAENRDLHDFFVRKNIEHTYLEGPGAHTYAFWDTYIEKAFMWMRGGEL